MKRRTAISQLASPFLTAALAALPRAGRAQSPATNRERGRRMLHEIKALLKRAYYDPTLGGRDIDAHFAAAEGKLEAVSSEAAVSGVIAEALVAFDDSHTFFVPPPAPVEVEYGWAVTIVGDDALITAVKAGSDAEAQGIRPGDRLLAVAGTRVTRGTRWKILYSLERLLVRDKVPLTIAGPDGVKRELVVRSEMKRTARFVGFAIFIERLEENMYRRWAQSRFSELADVLVWKLPSFSVREEVVDEGVRRARGKTALVLDLRGNPGGSVAILERLAGSLFEEPVVLAEVRERKKSKPSRSDGRGKGKVFGGRLVVMVDSGSASASEVLARAVQVHGRGQVIGDRTAGAVMESETHVLTDGNAAQFIVYGVSVTVADLVMPDGGHLEKVGVTPNVLSLPTPEDLVAGRDPVLSAAVALAGGTLDSREAGRLFPHQWRPLR